MGQLYSSGVILQVRDAAPELVILDAAGVHSYTLANGAFGFSSNVTLTGGAYVGQTIGSLISSGVHISVREATMVITDAAGAHAYGIFTGNPGLPAVRNPTLSGSPHFNLTVAQAFSAGVVFRHRDTAASSLVLLSAPVFGAPVAISPLCETTPQSAAINTAFTRRLRAVVRDSIGHAVPGVSVTFAPPASGASGTFSGSPTVTTDVNGVATAPVFTANGALGSYTVTATVSGVGAPASFQLTNTIGQPEGLDYYNVSSGAFAFSRNPTLSGGPYNGQALAQLLVTSGVRVDVRDAASDLVVLDANGWHDYSTTGAFSSSYNSTLAAAALTPGRR